MTLTEIMGLNPKLYLDAANLSVYNNREIADLSKSGPGYSTIVDIPSGSGVLDYVLSFPYVTSGIQKSAAYDLIITIDGVAKNVVCPSFGNSMLDAHIILGDVTFSTSLKIEAQSTSYVLASWRF